ncbi:MAG: hypothetical protein AAFY06_00175 [Pseudomonadota bacterium]
MSDKKPTPKERKRPNGRRPHENRKIIFRGISVHVGTSFDANGINEVFLSSGGLGSQLEHDMRDAAVVMSIALQHGATLDVISRAVTRDEAGSPTGILGVVADKLIDEEVQRVADQTASTTED